MNKKVWLGIGLAFLALWVGVLIGHFLPNLVLVNVAWFFTTMAGILGGGIYAVLSYEDQPRRTSRY